MQLHFLTCFAQYNKAISVIMLDSSDIINAYLLLLVQCCAAYKVFVAPWHIQVCLKQSDAESHLSLKHLDCCSQSRYTPASSCIWRQREVPLLCWNDQMFCKCLAQEKKGNLLSFWSFAFVKSQFTQIPGSQSGQGWGWERSSPDWRAKGISLISPMPGNWKRVDRDTFFLSGRSLGNRLLSNLLSAPDWKAVFFSL